MGKKKKKIPVDGNGPSLPDDRFAALAGLFADDSEKESTHHRESSKKEKSSSKNQVSGSVTNSQPDCLWRAEKTRKGNFDIRLEKRGGGKTVTVLSRLSGDLKNLLKVLRKKCASGGAVKGNTIEIQGDHIQKIDAFLSGDR